MFHASKWGEISLINSLKIKKIKKKFSARPAWLGPACHAQIGRGRAWPIWLAF
jgi:hypothetical protein